MPYNAQKGTEMIEGKHIAITGALVFYNRRKDAFAQILDRKGIPQNTVTKQTDTLVVGYYRKGTLRGSKSRKLRLAERYMEQGQSIQIIDEDRFLAMLWSSPVLSNQEERR